MLSPEAPTGDMFLPLIDSTGCQHSLVCDHTTPVSAFVVTLTPPLCLHAVKSPCLPLRRILLILLKAHTDNPELCCHFNILDIIISSKILFFFLAIDINISSFQGLGPDIFVCLFLGTRAMINLDSVLKSRDITLLTKVHSQSYGFSSNHLQMWELNHKEDWALKNWSFWTVVLKKTLESLLDCKFKPVSPKGNQL